MCYTGLCATVAGWCCVPVCGRPGLCVCPLGLLGLCECGCQRQCVYGLPGLCVAGGGYVHVVCTLQAGAVWDYEWQAGAVCTCQAGAVCV